MPESVGAFRGPGTTSGIPSFRDGPFRRKRAAFRTDIANWGWNFAAGAPDTTVAQLVKDGWFGSRLRKEIGHTVPRQVRLGFLMEQLPNSKNRVRIDPRRYRDALGEPRPVIEYHLDKYTMRGIVEAKRISDAIFAQLGIEQHSEYGTNRPGGYVEYQGTGFNYAGSGHLVGTHRMGRSADDSVVDTDMRAWDHRNLYVVGCGSMPTIGTSNPTLTMTALTYRAARRILKDLGG
jgi:choline dehydrogenase-like flavoprotein